MILRAPDRRMATTKPSNFVWNWETRVRDLVDHAECHKTNFFGFHHVREIIDHFGHVVRAAGKPFLYQSGQSGGVTHHDAPYHFLPFEMQWVRNHHHLTCYTIYETASVFTMTQNGEYKGSPHFLDIVKHNWGPSAR